MINVALPVTPLNPHCELITAFFQLFSRIKVVKIRYWRNRTEHGQSVTECSRSWLCFFFSLSLFRQRHNGHTAVVLSGLLFPEVRNVHHGNNPVTVKLIKIYKSDRDSDNFSKNDKNTMKSWYFAPKNRGPSLTWLSSLKKAMRPQDMSMRVLNRSITEFSECVELAWNSSMFFLFFFPASFSPTSVWSLLLVAELFRKDQHSYPSFSGLINVVGAVWRELSTFLRSSCAKWSQEASNSSSWMRRWYSACLQQTPTVSLSRGHHHYEANMYRVWALVLMVKCQTTSWK